MVSVAEIVTSGGVMLALILQSPHQSSLYPFMRCHPVDYNVEFHVVMDAVLFTKHKKISWRIKIGCREMKFD